MALNKISDSELITQYLSGCEKSFETLLLRHQDRVFSYIMTLVKNTEVANDVFQDTFTKVIITLKRGKYNDEGKFLPWVMRIAHNLVIDHFRKNSKMPSVRKTRISDGEDFDIFDIIKLEDRTVEEEIIFSQILKDVRHLIDFLPKEQREIVEMRHFMEMSFKDIAEQKDISINTALGRMRYALINLRKLIKEKDISLTLV